MSPAGGTFGRCEADLTTMVGRQTLFTALAPNPNRRSRAAVRRTGRASRGLPEGGSRTIAVDRGVVFVAYRLLADQIGAKAYFCDPHSPWRKGAVENADGRIRRFLPALARARAWKAVRTFIPAVGEWRRDRAMP